MAIYEQYGCVIEKIKMKILGYKITSWIKHPVLVWEAFKRSKLPVVDLDNPENNCSFCGTDHHFNERNV